VIFERKEWDCRDSMRSKEKAKEHQRTLNTREWEKFFAWKPTRISSEKIIWLEYAERKPVSPYIVSDSFSNKSGIHLRYWPYWYWIYKILCKECNNTGWIDNAGLSGSESVPCSCEMGFYNTEEYKRRLAYRMDELNKRWEEMIKELDKQLKLSLIAEKIYNFIHWLIRLKDRGVK